jgi:hypothetical protein
MIPGLYHCPCGQPAGGDPATVVDMVTPLVRWVRDGVAPAPLIQDGPTLRCTRRSPRWPSYLRRPVRPRRPRGKTVTAGRRRGVTRSSYLRYLALTAAKSLASGRVLARGSI